MTSGYRLALLFAALTLAGCGDFNAGPMRYDEAENLTREVADKTKANLAGKPKLQDAVRKAMTKQFGPDPQHIVVPAGSVLPGGGIRLANHWEFKKGNETVTKAIKVVRIDAAGTRTEEEQRGGYGLYRLHCLHCHGVSGAGNGPTADFLYPRPRDYRPGKFKFTSTPNGAKPVRDDLRKTIREGLHGTSMPAFEALMSPAELEQVLDYVVYLSIRGETEQSLIEEAAIADENDPNAISDDVVASVIQSVVKKWKDVETQVLNPPLPRTASTRESVLHGRDLFLGYKSRKGNTVDCVGCHGPEALGNGASFVAQEVFNDVVFGGNPSQEEERLAKYSDSVRDLWGKSLDDWGRPLRPNNLNRGIYKGGRRPLDLYWRISKGITGAKMPGHYPTIEPDEIWDLVNFVLALPYDSKLLENAKLPPKAPAAPAVARR